MTGQIDMVIIPITQEMIHNWGWLLAFGIVLMLLGLAAIVRSVAWVTNPRRAISAAMSAVMEIIAADLKGAAASAAQLVRR